MYGTPGLACPAFYGFLNEDDHADHGHAQVLFQKPLLIFDLPQVCSDDTLARTRTAGRGGAGRTPSQTTAQLQKHS